jgi:hypothetical protein
LESHTPKLKDQPSGMQMLHRMLVSHVLNTAEEVQSTEVPVTPVKEGEPTIHLTEDELTLFLTLRSLANVAAGMEYMGFMLNNLNQLRAAALTQGSEEVREVAGSLEQMLVETNQGPGLQGAYYRVGQSCQVAMSAMHRFPMAARILTEVLKTSNNAVMFHHNVELGQDVEDILQSLQGRTEDSEYFDTLVKNNVREILDLLIRVEDNLPGAMENQGLVQSLVADHLNPLRLALINHQG